MKEIDTKIIKLDPNSIDMDKLAQAAEIIRAGGLVAFPTETVYGLGADALNEAAVRRIFIAKGRPADNPLIVHISSVNELDRLAAEIAPQAEALMDAFWPGPLTLIFKKTRYVSAAVTAGLETVAVRMPSHPIALALIKQSGVSIAAPSANRSGKPSPTLAGHVAEDLRGRVDAIIDAGDAEVGLESTVLDMTVDPPAILRPGGITPDQLLMVLREVAVEPLPDQKPDGAKPKAPGMKYRHYAPRARLIVFEGGLENIVSRIIETAGILTGEGKKVGILSTEQTAERYKASLVIPVGDRNFPETIASNLFKSLRKFDEAGVDIILAEAVKSEGIGLAVMNRLKKAAGHNVVRVPE